MYCDAANSPRRRATQFVMSKTYDALCRWLAPILAFTTEEAWRYSGAPGSVHLQLFPQDLGQWRNRDAHNRMSEAVYLRIPIMREIEKARQQKLIGNSLEAEVIFHVPPRGLTFSWDGYETQLEEIFLVSAFQFTEGEQPKVEIRKTSRRKCARCWRHRPAVGASADYPDLCDRCASVVGAARNTAKSK
jgi:isoleucyl-tRNA synthetase